MPLRHSSEIKLIEQWQFCQRTPTIFDLTIFRWPIFSVCATCLYCSCFACRITFYGYCLLPVLPFYFWRTLTVCEWRLLSVFRLNWLNTDSRAAVRNFVNKPECMPSCVARQVKREQFSNSTDTIFCGAENHLSPLRSIQHRTHREEDRSTSRSFCVKFDNFNHFKFILNNFFPAQTMLMN